MPPLRALTLLALTGCVPDLGATAKEVGVLPARPTVQGRDGGASGMAFGHSVWSYGDTVLDAPDAEGVSWHPNSWSWTDDLVAADSLDGWDEPRDAAGAPTYLVPPTADEAAYTAAHAGDPCAEEPCGARWAAWPGAPLWDEARQRALIPYGLIHAEPGAFNFYGVGQGFAVWDAFDAVPRRPETTPGATHPTLLFGEGERGWGSAAVLDGDDLFAFDCDSDGDGFEPPCRLAKVPVPDVLDRAAWRFWDGRAWSADPDDAEVLFVGSPNITVGWNDHLGAWTAIYAQPLSEQVVLRTAATLTGPWSAPGVLFRADKAEGWPYDAYAHAELAEEGGRVLYVTFTRSNGVGWFGSEVVVVRVELVGGR